MALSERPFGLPFGGPSVYLDTSQSEVVDATEGEAALFVPGEEFVLGALRACIKILLLTVAPSLLCSIDGLSADFQKGLDAYGLALNEMFPDFDPNSDFKSYVKRNSGQKQFNFLNEMIGTKLLEKQPYLSLDELSNCPLGISYYR